MITLDLPHRRCYSSYMEAIEEYEENRIKTYDFVNLPQKELFEFFENFRSGRNLPQGYVKATYLWMMEEEEFIAEISIRHSLTKSLERLGGHIGYGVRYSKWGRGYATAMLCMAMRYANEKLHLNRLLITCNDDNYPSASVIEKNGGILQDKVVNGSGDKERITRRYWVDIRF